MRITVRGAPSLGFSTTVFPTAKAGAIFSARVDGRPVEGDDGADDNPEWFQHRRGVDAAGVVKVAAGQLVDDAPEEAKHADQEPNVVLTRIGNRLTIQRA